MSGLMASIVATLDRFALRHWRKTCRVLILGLQGAGKTSVLYHLPPLSDKAHDHVIVPTLAHNVEWFDHKSVRFVVWDMCAHHGYRHLWHLMFDSIDALVFVVDASDTERMDTARIELHDVLQHDLLRDCKLVVLCNKQDKPKCMNKEEIKNQLALEQVTDRDVIVHETVAVDTTHSGVMDAVEWLVSTGTSKVRP